MIYPKTRTQELIVREALEMFKTSGVKAVRMDDVARHLRMSKRTLYEFFEDKEQLLFECVKLNASEQAAVRSAYAEQSRGVMDMLCFFIKRALSEFSNCDPKFYIEVMSYKSVREFVENLRQNEKASKDEFLRRGVEEGLIKDDINFELLHEINKGAMDRLLNEKIYDKFSSHDIFYTFIMVFIRGLLTEKGLKELNKCLEG